MNNTFRNTIAINAANATPIIYKEKQLEIERCVDEKDYERIENILKALDKAKIRLNANVNFDLTMELLLLTMKEN